MGRGQQIALFLTISVIGTSCQKESFTQTEQEWWRLEQRKIDLQHQIEISQMRVNRMEQAEAQSMVLHSQAKNIAARHAELAARRANLEMAVSNLEGNLSSARNLADKMVSSVQAGQKFETLTTPSGKHFEKVTVVRIDDAGVDIRHSTGRARLGYSDLSPEMRLAFGLDADRSRIALERESLASAQYESQINRDMAQQSLQQALATPKTIARNTLVPESVRTSPLHEPARTVGGSTRHYYYGSYGNYGYYRNYYTRYYYVPYYVPVHVARPSLYSPTVTPTTPSMTTQSATSTEKSSPSDTSP